MKYTVAAIALACVLPLLSSGCKTTEENYRAAYEKTIEARKEQTALDSTVYGAERRRMQSNVISTSDGPVEVRAMLVKVTEGGGGIPENLKRFNVVAGQFKQQFNALSLRDRLVDKGYPGAFVVQTAEPYYYIVAGSYIDAAEAAKAMEALKKAQPVAMKEPCPFILDATTRRNPRR